MRQESHRVREEFTTLPRDERLRQQVAFAGPAKRGKQELKKDIESVSQSFIKKLRKKSPQAYKGWSEEDDKRLKREYGIGKKIAALASLFSRTEGAVRARLKKIGIED